MSAFLDEIGVCIPALRRYARSLTRDASRADDLVQDCLERAIRKQALWRASGTVKSWLFKMLLNLYRNELRRDRRAGTDRIEDIDRELSVAPSQPGRIAFVEIAHAVDALPADQREALLLVVLEGCSYAEAAAILDIVPGTLMSRLGRARENLRRMTDRVDEVKLRTVK